MAFELTTAARNAACDAIVDLLDGGTVTIYQSSGAPPAVNAAANGTLLASPTFGSPAFGAAAAGVATANAIGSALAAASGEADYFRLVTSGAATVAQGAAGDSGSDLNLGDATIVAGADIGISSMTVTVPESA